MSRLTTVLSPVELRTMTVRAYSTMLPPIWVAACDSQRRTNAPLRKTASALSSGAGAWVAASLVTRPGPTRAASRRS